MKRLLLYLLILPVLIFLLGCGAKPKESVEAEPKPKLIENPATDFQYVTAIDFYGETYALKAVKKGEITGVHSVIIKKYIGNSVEVVVPKTIDGHPVEIIDNYAFSPYNPGLERDDEFWKQELTAAKLPLEGNGTATVRTVSFGSPYMKAFVDAIVSTSYRETAAGEEKYDPKNHYVYYDDDFNKVIEYLRTRPKSSKLQKVTLPDGIRAIGGGAFMFCDSLKTVQFPKSRIICNDFAFAFCTELQEVDSSLTADVDGCFLGCVNLSRVINKGHHIGAFMFAGCVNLEYLAVARQTKYAKEYALYRCPKLTGCNFPISFKLSPEFLDFNYFTARLSKQDASFTEFKEKGYPFEYR